MSDHTTEALNELQANPSRWQDESNLFYALIESDSYTPEEAMDLVLLLRSENVRVSVI